MTTDTPRTDAARTLGGIIFNDSWAILGEPRCFDSINVVPADFARELELELDASKAEVKLHQGVYAAALKEWQKDAQRLSELDAERRQWLENREKSTFQNWIDRAEKAEAEVERLTKKLSITEDELADAREWLNERYKATSEADERAEKAEAKANKLENSLRRIIDAPVFDPAKLIDFSMKLLWNSIDEAKATLNPTEK